MMPTNPAMPGTPPRVRRRALWQSIWSIGAAMCSACVLSGCDVGSLFPDTKIYSLYGVPPVPLAVRSFEISPPNPLHTGDTLSFYAEIEPVVGPYATVIAWLGRPITGNPGLQLALRDDGVAPDLAANDNIFSGSAELPATSPGEYAAFVGAGGLKDGKSAAGSAQLTLEVLP